MLDQKLPLRGIVLRPLVLLLACILASTAFARGEYPAVADPYVNDFAAILSDAQTTELGRLLADYEQRSGIRVVAVTVRSFAAYDTGAGTIEQFATGLFNHWGIGDPDENDGVLILLAHGDRKVRIEVGSGYGRHLDQPMQRVIDQAMVPAFRSGDFGLGTW